LAERAEQQQAQGLRCSRCGAEGKFLNSGMCKSCHKAGRAEQQLAQGLCCSGCRREGLLLSGSGLCRPCNNKLKAEADQRAAIEEYTAAKAKQTAKAKEAEKRVLYL
jgi:hypothetical protein